MISKARKVELLEYWWLLNDTITIREADKSNRRSGECHDGPSEVDVEDMPEEDDYPEELIEKMIADFEAEEAWFEEIKPHNDEETSYLDGLTDSPWHDKTLEIEEREEKLEMKCIEAQIMIQKERNCALLAQGQACITLQEALLEWAKFNLPGKREATKAKIQRAVLLYSQPETRSCAKIAKAFKVSPKQVSVWLKLFTQATGFKVVLHRQHESVRSHIHGPTYRHGRKTIMCGEETPSEMAENDDDSL